MFEVLVYFIGKHPKVSAKQSLCPFEMDLFYCRLHIFIEYEQKYPAGYYDIRNTRDTLLIIFGNSHIRLTTNRMHSDKSHGAQLSRESF